MTTLNPQRPARRLILSVAINSTGSSDRSWSWPGTEWNRFADFQHYLRSAQLAHEGRFDIVFVSDHPALQRDGSTRPIHSFDPTVLFSAIAAVVPDIGFLLTASSSYNSPYNLARRLATLDHVSGGRVIWNVVSSFNPDIAANFGAAPLPPRAERYRRADEFVDVVKKLWLSWDTPRGPKPDKVWDETTARRIDHHGEFFDVQGPLNVPIGPQGYPVIAQAGASDAGIDLAAKHADLVYASLLHKQAAFAYRARLRERALVHGRNPDDIRLVPGLIAIVGETREEAYRKHEALHGNEGEAGLIRDFFKRAWAFESSEPLDPDKPIDPKLFHYTEDQQRPVGFTKAFAELTEAEELTPRQLVRRVEGGHRLAVGTPREVADTILDWWSAGAVDGFNVHIPILPEGIAEFNRTVIPLLQEAGAIPREYDGSTLRERFQLPIPRPGSVAAQAAE